MPSFDIVSELNTHEVANAVDQANREVTTRFDFKGSGAKFVFEKNTIRLSAENDFQIKQMMEILKNKLTKRGVDLGHMKMEEPVIQHKKAEQLITLQEGIDQESAKKIIKLIKNEKIKVQATIQSEKVRVTGKKKDDLQQIIEVLRKQELGLPLQFNNFRD